MTDKPKTRLSAVELDATIGPGPSPEAEHERRVAIYDLVEENSFTLLANPQGPYRLRLSTADGRLIFDVLSEAEDRLTLICPTETRDNARSHAVAKRLAASNGPIGRVEYVDVRQSMRNGGGPACLRLRVVLNEAELAATNPAMRLTDALYARLSDWARRWYRDELRPADLADPALLDESWGALDELTRILQLGGDFYPFQRP